MFSNFVDDMVMGITHILRGEDHLTNTAGQVALYKAFGLKPPIYWHMPILCNLEGKKLSKRDFGFSLKDLIQTGYLPEAICNYLAILGGSFEQEIMSLDELAKKLDFDNPHAKGQIKYDVEKLNWINHKWIDKYDPERLAEKCLPYLEQAYPEIKNIKKEKLVQIIQILKTDLIKLSDIVQALHFYFKQPTIKKPEIDNLLTKEKLKEITDVIKENLKTINDPNQFVINLKTACKQKNISLKEVFTPIRIALIGKAKGAGIGELIEILGADESQKRIGALF
jgi:nondiscriminating glutamyl-tRNA synthetase